MGKKIIKSRSKFSMVNLIRQVKLKRPRIMYVTLLRKIKKQYFSSLESTLISDNKKLWRPIKALFLNNFLHKESINSTKTGETIDEDYMVAETYNCLITTVNTLCIRDKIRFDHRYINFLIQFLYS